MVPIKVLHLIETLGSGGAERLLHTNLKHLDQNLVESEVVTVFSQEDFWKKPINELGIKVTSLDCGGKRDIIRGVSRLRKYYESNPPDLIHTHLWTANVIGRLAGYRSGIKVISSIHNPEYDPAVFSDTVEMTPFKLWVSKVIDKWSAHFGCTAMVAVSHFVKENLSQAIDFPPLKIRVIYNPVDTFSSSSQVTKQEILKRLNLPSESLILLSVGRLVPQKGFIHAVRSMPEILHRFPTAQLLIVGAHGETDYKNAILKEIDHHGLADKVHFLGARRDVIDFLTCCDVFVFPSLYEGLGIALTEAMSLGKAAVVSNIRPVTEFIEDGSNGLLAKPKDASSISDAVCRLLGDEKLTRQIGEQAIGTTKKLFDPDRAVQELYSFYAEVRSQSQ